MTLRQTLQALLTAAENFEAKAARHRRIESERQALREAITQAQLVLSLADKEETAQKRAKTSVPTDAIGQTVLRGIPGGRTGRARTPPRQKK